MSWTVRGQMVGTEFEGLALGYLAGMVAMVTHAIAANTFIIVRIMEPLWFLAGVVAILPQLPGREIPVDIPDRSPR